MKVMARVLHVPPSLKKPHALWLALAMLTAVLILHVLINSVAISEKFFWGDETTTYDVAKLPFLEATQFLQSWHKQPPLFYWLAHIVISFDDSPAVLRGISFVFLAGTLVFAMLCIKELSLSSRLILALLLTISPYAHYVSTEFRPYAMAVFFILTSSVFLYRALEQRQRWGPAIVYGVFALGLQYSLTLNCWVFACQMLAVGVFLLFQIRKEGLRPAIVSSRELLAVCLGLCLGYILFLAWVSRDDVLTIATYGWVDWTYEARLADNFKKEFVPKIMLVSDFWWFNCIAIGLFIAGFGLARKHMIGVSAFWMTIFIGQLGFSTYMTYTRIVWFSVRYLTSSYVAFALLGALGYEFLFARRWPGGKSLIPALALLILIFLGTTGYPRKLTVEYLNPFQVAIDELKCGEKRSLVFCSPGYSCTVPAYEYRNSNEVQVLGQLSLQQLREANDDESCILYIVTTKRMERKAMSETGATWLAEGKAMEQEALAFLQKDVRYREEVIDLTIRFRNGRFPDYMHIFRRNPETSP
jgi:hypothetical protein